MRGRGCYLPLVGDVEDLLEGALEIDGEGAQEDLGLIVHRQGGGLLELSVQLLSRRSDGHLCCLWCCDVCGVECALMCLGLRRGWPFLFEPTPGDVTRQLAECQTRSTRCCRGSEWLAVAHDGLDVVGFLGRARG
jgi:hypothetical protein